MIGCLLAGSRDAHGQGNYEIQVYGSDTVPPKNLMVELHSNYTVSGQTNLIDGNVPDEARVQDEENDPSEEFELYLACGVCGDNGLFARLYSQARLTRL